MHFNSTLLWQNKNNPENHEGIARRFVMFGGGISSDQLAWLKQQLHSAKQDGQQVLLFSHLPLHPDTCVGTCLLWNFEEVLQAIWDAGNVVATITGHAHKVRTLVYTRCSPLWRSTYDKPSYLFLAITLLANKNSTPFCLHPAAACCIYNGCVLS